MSDIVGFSRNIRSLASKIDNGSIVLVKTTAKKVLRALCYDSPADKGVMRSNYRVSIGGSTTAVIPAYAPGKNLGMAETANASSAFAVGAAKINSVGFGKLDKSIKIQNNVGYLNKVNGGSVIQTAPGFVERSIRIGEGYVRQFKFFGTGRSYDDDEAED